MDNNEKIILVPTSKEKVNSTKKMDFSLNANKFIISLLIIIVIIQFFVINLLLFKSNTIENLETKENIENNIEIKERRFLYKEDNKTNIETNKIEIHIAMAFDIKIIYPTLVSVTSALENNDKNKNILVYHFLLPHNFQMEKIDAIESLKEKYDFRANYYKIPNIFKNMRKWRNSITIYYKLLLPLILPNLERIIFFDCDTLIFKDLSEMFFLPFNDAYVLGFPFHTPNVLYRFGIRSNKYINVGVLLFNIKKIREDGKDLELINFTMQKVNKFVFPEQDTMNYVYFNKTGLLPLKYGIYLVGNITQFQNSYMPKMGKIDINEMQKAIDDPSVVHLVCCNPKVWFKKTKHERKFNHTCQRYQKEFYYYANKTKYYDKIYNKYMKR